MRLTRYTRQVATCRVVSLATLAPVAGCQFGRYAPLQFRKGLRGEPSSHGTRYRVL